MLGILSLLVLLPAIMAAPTYLLGKKNPRLAAIIGIGTTAVVFLISIVILFLFSYGRPGFQLMEVADWASSFGLEYKVAIDGISLPLILIATILSLLAAAGASGHLLRSGERVTR